MRIEEFRPVMTRVLTQSVGKKLGIEEVVERMISAMQDVESVVAQMGDVNVLRNTQSPEERARVLQELFLQFNNKATDISRRIDADADNKNEGLVEIWSRDQLADFARNQMPSQLTVQPQGFDQPFVISKFI